MGRAVESQHPAGTLGIITGCTSSVSHHNQNLSTELMLTLGQSHRCYGQNFFSNEHGDLRCPHPNCPFSSFFAQVSIWSASETGCSLCLPGAFLGVSGVSNLGACITHTYTHTYFNSRTKVFACVYLRQWKITTSLDITVSEIKQLLTLSKFYYFYSMIWRQSS